MLGAVLNGSYKMSLFTTMAMLFAIGYILFPFDVVPDFIPVLGWIDDGLVFYLLLRRLSKETQRYNRYKAMERRK